MARVIAVANQKGGVGKTTSCVNLAASLAVVNKKILLIDMDPQGNATMGSGIDKYKAKLTLADLILDKLSISESIQKSKIAGFDVIPGNDHLVSLEVKLLELAHKERQLYFLLENIQEQYDFILLDCPPSLNMLTVNALVAADGVLIPMQCEYYALEGLSALVKTINGIRRTANPRLQIEGLLRTMYDARNKLSLAVTEELKQHFGSKLFTTVIPRNVRLAEAPSHGMPVLQYDKHSRGAAAYMALAGEFLKKMKQNARAELAVVD